MDLYRRGPSMQSERMRALSLIETSALKTSVRSGESSNIMLFDFFAWIRISNYSSNFSNLRSKHAGLHYYFRPSFSLTMHTTTYPSLIKYSASYLVIAISLSPSLVMRIWPYFFFVGIYYGSEESCQDIRLDKALACH